MKRNTDFIIREIAGETILVPTGQASKDLNGLITLNETAAFIWDQIDKAKDEADLIQKVLDEFEIDEETVGRDVREFLSLLSERNMVIV